VKADVTDGLPNGELAIALSGGGLRATYFGLGALLYLVDAGLNRRVRAISSVSGGSILSGFVASRCDFREVGAEGFDAVAGDLLRRTVRRGLLHSSIVWAYIGLMALAGVVLIGLSLFDFPLAVPWWTLVAGWFCWAAVLLLRGVVLTFQFGRILFNGEGSAATSADVTSSVEHIFCATDLPTASPLYFSTWSGGYVYSPVYGTAKGAGFGLNVIVRSSAAFPGGIPPKRLALWRLSFPGPSATDEFAWNRRRRDSAWIRWRQERLRKKLARVERRWWLSTSERNQIILKVRRRMEAWTYFEDSRRRPSAFLADGGIWNNLATDPFLVDRLDRGTVYGGRSTTIRPACPVELSVISIDSSISDSYASSRLMVVPVIAELLAFTRATKILYTNTVAPRAATLREEARLRVASGEIPRNLVVSLAEWRGDVAHHWFVDPYADRPPQNNIERRAQQLQTVGHEWAEGINGAPFRHVIDRQTPTWALGEGESTTPISGYSSLDCEVPTTLSGLGQIAATRLLVHGYINAMVEAHIAWDVPLVSDLSIDRFERLFSVRGGEEGVKNKGPDHSGHDGPGERNGTPGPDLRQRSIDLLFDAMNELCIGSNLGRVPFRIRRWEARCWRMKRQRAIAWLFGRLLRVKAPRWGRVRLPAPSYLDIWGPTRLYEEEYAYQSLEMGDPPQRRRRTPGYHWDVRDKYGNGTYFTATVNASGQVEFESGVLVFPADPQGWRALIAKINKSTYRHQRIRLARDWSS
jgi:hypothetical protein